MSLSEQERPRLSADALVAAVKRALAADDAVSRQREAAAISLEGGLLDAALAHSESALREQTKLVAALREVVALS